MFYQLSGYHQKGKFVIFTLIPILFTLADFKEFHKLYLWGGTFTFFVWDIWNIMQFTGEEQ